MREEEREQLPDIAQVAKLKTSSGLACRISLPR
jgi:hypothetical protein